jgi:hypothetical protein
MRINFLRLDYFCRWRVIKGLFVPQATKLLLTYFLSTPFFVAIFGALPKKIDIGGYLIAPRLPFSWEIFYIGSLFYSLGFLIFTLKCPSFLKLFDSLSDFRSTSSNQSDIFSWLARLLILSHRNRFSHSQTTHLFFLGYFEPISAEELAEIERITDSATIMRHVVGLRGVDEDTINYILDKVDIPNVYSGYVVLRLPKVMEDAGYEGKIFDACARGFDRYAPNFRYCCILLMTSAYACILSMLLYAVWNTISVILPNLR